MPDSMIADKRRMLWHAQDYRERAKALQTTNPAWVTGTIEERTTEYIYLAGYFERLANV